MKPDDFESRLRRQPLRPIPPEWRAEILAAAAATPSHVSRPAQHGLLFALFTGLFWPHPRAWAGLATAWVLVLMVHLAIQERPATAASQSARPSTDLTADLRPQHQLYAELMGISERSETDRPRTPASKPRGERWEPAAS